MTTESDMAPAPLRAADFSLDFPFSLGRPVAIAGFRTLCADFVVEEELGFTPEGGGEHLYLHIRKENQNTRWVAKLLAEYFAVEEQAVGYSGLKDRHAITSQWFSIHLPGAENPLPLPIVEGCEILASSRHPRKLRPGTHLRNHFEIRLRDVSGSSRQEIDARLEAIVVNGVPNYFGEQRFGIDGGNLREVEKILAQRQPRFKGRRGGLYLSAARSWLFNQVLAARVLDNSWRAAQAATDDSAATQADGPLWGRGRSQVDAELAAREADILAPWQHWCHGLEHSGLKQERRPLALMPGNLQWRWEGSDLILQFSLPPGCYATAVLRELAVLTVPEAMV